LLCVGGKLIEGYRRLAGMSGIGNRVHFVDPSEDVFRHYAAADAVVQLSWHDPASRSVLEAVRWGIPTLTSAFDGASQIVARGAGVVVDSPANLRDVTDGLQLLTDPQVRTQFSTACTAVQNEISLDRHVEQLLDGYKKVSL
jgi:UDP-glucose:(heptosyl)LPS alpha-1,3-glucosyltransferase